MAASEISINGRPVSRIAVGGEIVWEKHRLPEGIVCWYDTVRQRCTNEQMIANPILRDLSGNGNDMRLYDFTFDGITNGIIDGWLVLDTKGWGMTVTNPEMDDVTVIALREHIAPYQISSAPLTKRSGPSNNMFVFEQWYSDVKLWRCAFVKAGWRDVECNPGESVAWMTGAGWYCGTQNNRGGKSLNADPIRLGRPENAPATGFWRGRVRSIMIFNRSLSTDEVNDVINKYF